MGQLLLLRIKGSMLCNICLLFLTASLRPEIDLGQGEVSDANCTQVITSFVSPARIVNLNYSFGSLWHLTQAASLAESCRS